VSATTDYPEFVEGLSYLPGRKKKGSPSTSTGREVLYAVALSLATPLLADSNLPPAYWSNRQLPDPKQEAQAQALMEQLRCLVCQGQSIADSDAELAGDMRDLVRRRIAAGEKPGAIRAWLIQRYGTWISYKPTAEPAAWPLWLAPLALLLVGAWLIRRRIRVRGR
jgi:cytochrome c-type biogenesis protein CcmH